MSYLNCPRCGLSVQAHPAHVAGETCPRCRGRAGALVPMYETDRPRPPVAAGDREPQAA
jgi:Zn-finger nucleic acid-binding protein